MNAANLEKFLLEKEKSIDNLNIKMTNQFKLGYKAALVRVYIYLKQIEKKEKSK